MADVGGILVPSSSYRGVSEPILKNLSFERGTLYGREGYTYFNDFLTATAGLTTHAGTGCTVGGTPDLAGGGVRISMDGTANDEANWGPAEANSAPYAISTASDVGRVAFEIRLKKSLVSNNSLAFVAGLGKKGLVADALLADSTGALADVDFIGFQVLNAAGGTVNFVYRKTGQALQTAIAGVATMTADTFVKLGFVYEPRAESSKRIRVLVNGVESTTYVTGTNIAAATFPLAVALNPIVGALVGSGAAAATLDTDWLFVHQETA
jgi:hypothetical protein